MRDFIAVVEEARGNVQDNELAELETAVQTIADYIKHNQTADFIKAATILDKYGYQEPVKQTKFYRALFHTITKVERETCRTIANVFEQYSERGGGFNLGGVQGCAATHEGVYAFTHRCWQTSRNATVSHYPNTPVTELHDIAIIYEIEVPLGSILMSMRGLQSFLRGLPSSSAKSALDAAMNDIGDGYSGDDEVLVNTDSGARITGMSLWNSKKGESW